MFVSLMDQGQGAGKTRHWRLINQVDLLMENPEAAAAPKRHAGDL
jgi:hypothetical protein